MVRPFVSTVFVLSLLLTASAATAQVEDPDFEDALKEQEAEDQAEARDEDNDDWPYNNMELGLRVFGMGGATAILDNDGTPALQNTSSAFNYPAFSSTSFGGGAAVSAHIHYLMGELSVAFTKDGGSGVVGDERVTLGQSATHVSVLVGMLLPFPSSWDVENLRVGVGVGYDLIFPFEPSLSPALTLAGRPSMARAEFYSAVLGGLKFELRLPTKSDSDIRFVTQTRIGTSPGLATEVSELVKVEGEEVVFRSEFQFSFYQTMGLAIYFH